MKTGEKQTPWIFWPLKALMGMVGWIIMLTGRVAAGAIGLALMIIGAVLTALVITAPLGLPLAAFGFLLMMRSIF